MASLGEYPWLYINFYLVESKAQITIVAFPGSCSTRRTVAR
jgi:hypothetical protein